MKLTDLHAVALVPIVMAASSLFSMIASLQIDKIVHQDLYRYGLQFSVAWAKAYWDMTAVVFAAGWFNIIVATAFQICVLIYGRKEAKQFAAEVEKEISGTETGRPEKGEEPKEKALAPAETPETEAKESEVLEIAETQERKEEMQVVIQDTTGQPQAVSSQPKHVEEQTERGSAPSEKDAETEQKEARPETEEKSEITLTPIEAQSGQEPRLGVSGLNLTPEIASYYNVPIRNGALITEVMPDSPAEKAEMKTGDIIIGFGDKNIDNVEDLVKEIHTKKIGDKAKVLLLRDGKKWIASVTLDKREEETQVVIQDTTG